MTVRTELLTEAENRIRELPRIDQYLSLATDMSRSAAARLIESGSVSLNGSPVSKKTKVREGDTVCLTLDEPVPSAILPEDIPLDILYEDGDLLIVNKPSGMVVHPAPGNETGTLVNALLNHCGDSLSGIGGVIRPGIVHRIDKETSGLLVVAKNDRSHQFLTEQLQGHRIDRVYTAILIGTPAQESGTVDAPIGRHPVDRKKMAVVRDGHSGRESVTHYRLLESFGGLSYVRCSLETGRTHQIRVHMAFIGHPVLGDPLYGGSAHPFCKKHPQLVEGQFLHAGEITLIHPTTGKELHFTCPLPANMAKALEIIRAAAGQN
ncbi:MAG: RluA family pseudouridine synthase [Clostridia bacterium]|nr:RluA family pseudouridine synthase [Clostridia bacterium]